MSSSSSHQIILTSSPDGPITAYDPSSGTTLAHFSGSRSPFRGLVLAGRSFIAVSHISSATGSSFIHLYNWWSSIALHKLAVPEPVAPLAATVDGMYLFAGGISGRIYSLSLPSGTILNTFLAHDKAISCLKISDDGSLLVSGHGDGTIVVVPIFKLVEASGNDNSSDHLALYKFVEHENSVTSITFCMGSRNSTIVSCSLDCTCKFWNILNGTVMRKLRFPCAILDLALDPTETSFYAAGSDGLVYHGIVNAATKQVRQRQKFVTWDQKHDSAIVSVKMVNEGQNLVSAAEDGCVWLWDVERGHVIMVIGKDMCGGVSDLVVASEVGGDANGHAAIQGRSGSDESGSTNYGLCIKELINKSVMETVQMEDVFKVVAKDRTRAIDMLESAIAMYERLLELILKQAKGGTSKSTNEKENGDM
ncbi:WD40 domain-containing protein [Cephalotus follicularis]|uniref:WD40 domain-containing protein n=1 Tax=Cephalotus follicularis TaxID=3775 RepID=A0A1Q3D3F5_CEPFO|nr:WD40 domain-containing protein [Cephalotus follicularis]